MCKLCNTDRPSITKSKSDYGTLVYEYLNEYPCTQCMCALNAYVKSSSKIDLDMYILRKLYLSYRAFSALKFRDSKLTKARTTRNIAGIQCISVQYKNHQNTRYKPVIYAGGDTVWRGASHETFQEALTEKINYMVKHNHIKGLKTLQNKLKELQCQN